MADATDLDALIASTPALDLDALIAATPATKRPVNIGPGETFLNRAVDAVPLANVATNSIGAVLLKALSSRGGASLTPQARAELEARGGHVAEAPGLLDTYRKLRDERSATTEAGSQQNPWAGRAGTAAGTLASLLAPLPKAGALGEGFVGKQLLPGMLTGAGYGAEMGLEHGPADLAGGDVAAALKNAALYGAFGLGMGAAVPLALRGGQRLLRALAGGVVNPTPEAQLLREAGVPLTTGQMDPHSPIAQLEEVGTGSAVAGPALKAQREAAREGWQRAALSEGAAPFAAGPRPGANPNQAIEDMANSFEPAYGVLEGRRISPELHLGQGKWRPLVRAEGAPDNVMRGAFDLAANNPAIRATDATRNSIQSFLDNAFTSLPKGAQGANAKDVPADALLSLRSKISGELRRTLKGSPSSEDRAASQMLADARDAVSEVLNKQLPDDVRGTLGAADRAYSRFKVLEDAVARSGDKPEGFTPSQLSASIQRGTEKSSYAQGAGGRLRELARAGRSVLEDKVPKTGWSALAALPGVHHMSAPLSILANRPFPQRLLLGETALQRGAQDVGEWLNQQALMDLLRKRGAGALAPIVDAAEAPLLPASAGMPAYADDSERQRALAQALGAGR